MLKGTGEAYRRAKKLRREMTLPEILLWRKLRKLQTGYKWRKQHPCGRYDLCVEVDGEAHNRGDRPERDARRDAWLRANGILTLRVPAFDVLNNLEGVLTFINAAARERAPLHRPSGGPPPPGKLGED